MPLTQSQIFKYFKEWGLAKAVLTGSGGYLPKEAEDWRRSTTVSVLGKHKKPAEMRDRDMDLMLGAFRGVYAPDDFDGQMRLEQAERNRLLHGIQQDAPSAAWVESLCRDIYGTSRHEELSTPDLLKLRRRCAGAARKARLQAEIKAVSSSRGQVQVQERSQGV